MTKIDPLTVPDRLADSDLDQIQSLVFRGWASDFKYAAMFFFKLPREIVPGKPWDTGPAKKWLEELKTHIAFGHRGASATELPVAGGTKIPGRLQLALTTRGLRTLGLDWDVIKRFPYEAKAGMERRARVLGDPLTLDECKKELVANPDDLDLLENNKPLPTDWNDPKSGIDLRNCDGMLLLYAKTSDELAAVELEQRTRLKSCGGHAITTEWSSEWLEREPFGFADGLSQPVIRGQPLRDQIPPSPKNTISAGEILLGYRNEYNQVPMSPKFEKGEHPAYPDGFDVGKNGTFLVFRKLEQDVKGFWDTFRTLAEAWQGVEGIPKDLDLATEWLAARAMGRWTNGNSIATCPFEPGEKMEKKVINEFVYGDDPDGIKCPVAAHVRRANPRDERGGGADESWKVVKRHRILRRGRAYGVMPDPKEAIRGKTSNEIPTGLLFVCLQSNITHGFEFVQQIWNNNPGFHGIFQEPDPITGPGGGTFTIPAKPARLRTPELPRFVVARGGGYFFVPSRATIDLLAT
jgi:Dyp-type peroxidase family